MHARSSRKGNFFAIVTKDGLGVWDVRVSLRTGLWSRRLLCAANCNASSCVAVESEYRPIWQQC